MAQSPVPYSSTSLTIPYHGVCGAGAAKSATSVVKPAPKAVSTVVDGEMVCGIYGAICITMCGTLRLPHVTAKISRHHVAVPEQIRLGPESFFQTAPDPTVPISIEEFRILRGPSGNPIALQGTKRG